MPRSLQVPPFTHGLQKQGEGAARVHRVTVTRQYVLPLGCMGHPLRPPLPRLALLGPGFVFSWPGHRPASTLPISQCRPEKPGGQSHLYLPM